jgi:hypothetical protein
MLKAVLHIKIAWNDYFTGTPNTQQLSEYRKRQTFSNASTYVSNCLFISISSTSTGGALYCTSVTYLLVESTSFFSCRTSGQHGGAVYFCNSGGQCVLNKVCGYDCISTYTSSGTYGQFSHIEVNNGISSKNYVNYSSIARCVNELTNAYRTLNLQNGKICCPSVNVSMNKCYHRSGFYCQPYGDSNSITCSFSYSSISDNNAIYNICIWLYTKGTQYEIKSCNLLRNVQGTLDSNGMILTYGKLMIQDSCILENKATRMFCQSYSYTITLSNCTVDSTSNNGCLTTRNTVTKSFILALNHMSSLLCHSEYDSAGALTPITPPPSSPTKLRYYCSWRYSFYQSRLRDFVSLILY